MSETGDATKQPTLRLHCPKCQGAGLIPWAKLDRTMVCSGCQSWFRIENSALRELPPPTADRYRVQVRTHCSGWEEHRAVVVRPKSAQERIRETLVDFASHGTARWALAGALSAMLLAFWAMRPGDSAAAPRLVEVPADLEGRAVCLLESVARRDNERMFLLTDGNFHRAMRIWLANAKDLPTASPTDESLDAKVVDVRLKTEKTRGEQHETAQVQARLTSAGGKTQTLDQRWVKLAGGWAFQPPVLRSSAPAPPRQSPGTATRRR